MGTAMAHFRSLIRWRPSASATETTKGQQLVSCHFIASFEHGDNVILLGLPGGRENASGGVLWLKAIESGYRVLFTTAAHLFARLTGCMRKASLMRS